MRLNSCEWRSEGGHFKLAYAFADDTPAQLNGLGPC